MINVETYILSPGLDTNTDKVEVKFNTHRKSLGIWYAMLDSILAPDTICGLLYLYVYLYVYLYLYMYLYLYLHLYLYLYLYIYIYIYLYLYLYLYLLQT